MPESVKVGEAKTNLSKLLARVEAGEEFVITRGNEPIARLVPLERRARRRAVIDEILALRDSGRIKPVSPDEIRAWKHEGHKY